MVVELEFPADDLLDDCVPHDSKPSSDEPSWKKSKYFYYKPISKSIEFEYILQFFNVPNES